MTITNLVNRVTSGLINPIIYLLFGIALLLFLWGIVQYVIGAQGNETKLKQGKQAMIWGIIGLFIMSSAWGIVRALCDFFFGAAGCPR